MYSSNCDGREDSAELKVSHTVSTSNFASNVHHPCSSSPTTNVSNNNFCIIQHKETTNHIVDTQEDRYNYKDIKSYYHLTSSPLDLSTKPCTDILMKCSALCDSSDALVHEKINLNNNNNKYYFAHNKDTFSENSFESDVLNNNDNRNNCSNTDINRSNKDITVLYKANKDGFLEPLYIDTQLLNHFNNNNNFKHNNDFLSLLNQKNFLNTSTCQQNNITLCQKQILGNNSQPNQTISNLSQKNNITQTTPLFQTHTTPSFKTQTTPLSTQTTLLPTHPSGGFRYFSTAENTEINSTRMDPNDSDEPFNFKLQQQQQESIQQQQQQQSTQQQQESMQQQQQQSMQQNTKSQEQTQQENETQNCIQQNDQPQQQLSADKPTGMTFTIDFTQGHSPSITHNWTKLVPSKVHSGISERQEEQRKKRESRQMQKGERMRKSRSHSSYMCEGAEEGHDTGSHCSEDVRKSSKFTSPKRLPKSKNYSQTHMKMSSKSISKQPIRSAPPTKHPAIGQGATNEKTKKKLKGEVIRKEEEALKKLDGGVEGTAYLIKKMLQGMNTSAGQAADELASPSISRRLKMGISNSNKAPSETGTYTIDDEEEVGDESVCHVEVQDEKKKDVSYKVPVIDSKPPQATNKDDLPANYVKMKKELSEREQEEDDSCISPCGEASIERDDSFEKLMNETSTRLNALIDATSKVIRDVKGGSGDKLSTNKSQAGMGSAEKEDMSFFVVACDTPATRNTLSIATDDAAHDEAIKRGKSAKEVSKVCEDSFIGKKDFSLLQTSQTPLNINKTQSPQAPSQQQSKKQRYISNKFVPPVAKSLSNLQSASPSSSSSNKTFTRDADLKRCGSGRGMSVFNNPPKPNKAFLLRTNQVTEPVKTQAQVVQKKDRSKSVGSHHKLEIKPIKKTCGNNVDSKPHLKPKHSKRPVSPVSDYTSSRRYSVSSSASKNAATPRGTPRGSNKDASRLSRNEGGRYSLRADKSSISSIPSSFSSSSTTNLGETAWQRRKNYDARKFSTSSNSCKNSVKMVSNLDRLRDSSRESRGNTGGQRTRESSERRKREGVGSARSSERSGVKRGERVNKIAEMSHAVADNLNALACNNHLDPPAFLKMLPLFCHESPQSAFSHQIITKKRNKSENLHSLPRDSNKYDTVLVDSIQQVSKKVKSLADKLIGKMKDDVPANCTTPSDLDFWHKTSPELSTILHNLCKTEQHLQEVNKALSSEVTSCCQGPLPISPHLARKTGFIPIKRDAIEEEGGFMSVKRDAIKEEEGAFNVVDDSTFTRHTAKQLSCLKTAANTASAFKVVSKHNNNNKVDDEKNSSENPLHGDEYY